MENFQFSNFLYVTIVAYFTYFENTLAFYKMDNFVFKRLRTAAFGGGSSRFVCIGLMDVLVPSLQRESTDSDTQVQ